MTYRVYLTHTDEHPNGASQIKGEGAALALAVLDAIYRYTAQVDPSPIDLDWMMKSLDRAGRTLKEFEVTATIVAQDRSMVVEIFPPLAEDPHAKPLADKLLTSPYLGSTPNDNAARDALKRIRHATSYGMGRLRVTDLRAYPLMPPRRDTSPKGWDSAGGPTDQGDA